MKTSIFLVVAFAASCALPALANDPTMMNNAPTNSGGRTMSPERERWVHHRIHHLKQEMSEHHKADSIAREMDRFQAATSNNYGRFVMPEGASPAAQRQYMINRFEFLALKAEMGKSSPKDRAEMRALHHRLTGH